MSRQSSGTSKTPAVAIEVLVELAPRLRQRVARGVQHPGRDALGELLQHRVLVLGGQAHAHEALARRADEDRAERRVVALEGDVDQPRALGRAGEVAAHALPGGGSWAHPARAGTAPVVVFSLSLLMPVRRARRAVIVRSGRAARAYLASWKMIPSAVRDPLVMVLTPWRRPTL